MKKRNALLTIGAILYYIFLCAPIAGFLGSELRISGIILDTGRSGLLFNSLRQGLAAAVLCSIIGLLAALGIRTSKWRNSAYRWFFLLLLPVPYYIYALSWMYMMRFIDAYIPFVKVTLSGLAPCVYVNMLSFLPITTGIALVAMEHHENETEQMGFVYTGWQKTFFFIILPDIMPVILASGAIVFILSITDFSVPSLFQYNTYTMLIFSEYSRGCDLMYVGLLSLPLVVPVFCVLALILRNISVFSIRTAVRNNNIIEIKGIVRAVAVLAVVICIFQLVFPLITFAVTVKHWLNLVASIRLCMGELLTSMGISIMSGVFATALATPTALWLIRKEKAVFWIFAVFPIAVPSSLVAMGLLAFVNGSVLNKISSTILFPIIGCMIKYMPFALLIMAAFGKRIHQMEIDTARVYATSFGNYFLKIVVPMYRQGLFSSFAVVAVLSLGDESMGLILMPPGYQTLAVKTYNYLHYGASELVSGFCLITILFCICLLAAVRMTVRRKMEHD